MNHRIINKTPNTLVRCASEAGGAEQGFIPCVAREFEGGALIVIDGAMGTILQEKGLDTLPEIWNITKPDTILDIHKAYASTGCNVLKTNTFGANRLKLAEHGYTVDEIITAGVYLAKEAATPTGAQVAFDIGPTGKLLAPTGELDFEEAVSIFAEMVRAGTKAGADLILIETMSDTYEIKAAMLAAKENSNLPIWVTFSPDENGRLLTGADILTTATLIESLGASAIGLNCGTGPAAMQDMLAELCKHVQIPVIFSPNAGLPRVENGKTVFDLSPAEYAQQMKDVAKLGGTIFGGCCGTTPQHISEMVAALRDTKPADTAATPVTRISSYGQTVTLGEEIIIIGERINPTGKPKLKQALHSGDMEYIRKQALSQIAQGAKLLDVNVGLPGINEAEMLPKVVAALQEITPTPLVIDTSNPAAAEAALRIYNGKPLLNSVNGKADSLAEILPIAKKYGASLVALALDDNIPETAAGRIAVVEKITAAAAAHGIGKHDLVVDTLTMTIGTNSQSAKITLDALEHVRNTMGICTVLGLSNISFGLPQRELLNAGFLAMAAMRGLSAAIANPANEAIMNTLAIHNTLTGQDENCAAYVKRFSIVDGIPDVPKKEIPSHECLPLHTTVLKGLTRDAKKLAEELLATTAPLDIINTQLIPALDQAGQDFGSGKTFLPQLLMSAAAAKAAFEIIQNYMAAQGNTAAKRGKIVLATVKGDIHDIGKNIVKTLLENYNYHVIDLGKDVAAEEIVQTVLAENAPLVGLSALMTTTVANMKDAIALLREQAPHCKIMVGGAVLTQAYAKEIGADFYAPDAMGAVRVAEQVFEI